MLYASNSTTHVTSLTLAPQKGSLLALPTELNTPYVGTVRLVEGIRYDVVLQPLTRGPGIIDVWVKTGDDGCFRRVEIVTTMRRPASWWE
ncbi:hypothetical protein BJV74DRAFT_333049 [Russula compacta]|nr:hypothetical protein BJV74DRAFT_333049 [Russula compacta]